MNHTIRQQKMFDHITSKQRVGPSVMEEMVKRLGAIVFLGLMVIVGAWVLWMISKDYFDFIWPVFFN